MDRNPHIVIQKMWDVTIVSFQDARLLEAPQIDSIARAVYRLVDEMDRKKLILDLSKVQFLASAAIGMFTNLQKKSDAIQGSFILVGLKRELMKLFEIMKLTKEFRFAATEAEALGMFGYTAAG